MADELARQLGVTTKLYVFIIFFGNSISFFKREGRFFSANSPRSRKRVFCIGAANNKYPWRACLPRILVLEFGDVLLETFS